MFSVNQGHLPSDLVCASPTPSAGAVTSSSVTPAPASLTVVICSCCFSGRSPGAGSVGPGLRTDDVPAPSRAAGSACAVGALGCGHTEECVICAGRQESDCPARIGSGLGLPLGVAEGREGLARPASCPVCDSALALTCPRGAPAANGPTPTPGQRPVPSLGPAPAVVAKHWLTPS